MFTARNFWTELAVDVFKDCNVLYCLIICRKQFWSPVSIPDLVYEHLMTRLQSPPPMEPANSWAHHQWQLLLVLPPTTDISAVHWLKSVLSSAPPLLPTNMDAVELLSLSDKQKMKVIVKVI